MQHQDVNVKRTEESLLPFLTSSPSPVSTTTPSTASVDARKKGSNSSITSLSTPTSPKPPVSITSDSIQAIPPFRPRKSKEFVPPAHTSTTEAEHHLTIGPTGGAEWAKKLKEETDIHRSTDCITPKLSADASSSDSDLLKCSPVWPPRPRSPSGQSQGPIAALKPKPITTEASLSDSVKSVSSQETADEAAARGKFYSLLLFYIFSF